MKKAMGLLSLLVAVSLLLGLVPLRVYAWPEESIKLNINVTPTFKDPKFLAEIRKALQKGPGENVYSDELKLLTHLEVAGKEISSLAGIQFVTNLIFLRCENNKLTDLDLKKCTKLKVLHCWQNNLATLNVTQNKDLTELYCDKNKLTELDISNNTQLETLNCFTNKLTTLNVSKHKKLEYLNCYGNKLNKLDVTKNVKLKELRIQDTNISSVDVSKNVELIRFNCGNNQIAKLSVSKNVKLEALNCMNNQLTTLDVSKNPKLKELYCQRNYLPSEAAIIGLNKSKLDVFEFSPQASTPSAPVNLTAKASDKKVVLSWNMPVYGGTSTIKQFEVSSNNGDTWMSVGVETSYSFTNLTNGQSYTFKVRGVNSSGKGLTAAVKATPKKSEPAKTTDVTLSFSTEGGSLIEDISKPEGTVVDLTEYQPTYDGFSFEGWYGEAELDNKITSIKLDADTTIYAKWLPIEDEDPEPDPDPDPDETKTQPDGTGGGESVWVYVSIGLAVLLLGSGAGLFVRSRKRRRRP